MKVVVLTGAGISAESGVPTFRDADGLWEGHHVEDVATPEAYDAQPFVVHRFYDARRKALAAVAPNPAHHALARLEEALGDDLLVVTQNIDDLHERAGSSRVLHMHGELLSAVCRACRSRSRWERDLADLPPCPRCGTPDLRPDVVWFGEIPYEMDRIYLALESADLFVSIGTSGAVYPAAGFVQQAAAYGARTLELNLQVSEVTTLFDETRHGRAGELVPAWVEELLGR
ncbi:NAD-dependent deacylase [Nocardioides marmotae]|uniref:NAD-dependent protein deacylase n=1 Tax=Nocardioides marmotae TaxID=2663857 RepID=A0A6I3JDH9_9ACTN|nr:NAD-dependent deacylase [Nocardioides marmotae]MCR6032503.1 NAD-dependent protein deacylase [Gordonia jinghuaiqii]MBC9734283.1 NAD-dependent deacylase [Nocardioides marmotae]MTB85384.1 NAD-dependent protein deacylase [Nocardioides marmotae]MTB96152.1 NAD-dependent protein deacylase [Nocardioides marmotae]QKD99772.1 NAD-dependent deacylase [Nocardioides marmotae]